MAPQKRRHNHEGSSSRSEDDSASPKRARRSASVDDDQRAEDDAMEVATQAIKTKMDEAGAENVPADGGIIEEVLLENFMCHDVLDVKFGPFMNFVIGHNGSGKSAILTAITLALGGKAAATNRGSSMKSFIKEGQDTARITVRIKNTKDGFKTEQYGDTIVIERTFTRDGSSGYKLKSKQGRTISSKKEELDEVCDFYGFQVENPLTILTQDLARAFLATSTNAQKYNFFAKGVQLEQLDQDYGIIAAGVKSTEPLLESRKADVLELKAKAERAKEKVNQLQTHEDLRDKVKLLQQQMAWVQVRDAEHELEASIEKLNALENKILRNEQQKEQASEAFKEANRAADTAEQRVSELEAELGPIEDQKKQLKEEFDSNKKELQEKQVEEREIKGSLENAIGQIATIKNLVEEEESRLASRNGEGSGKLSEAMHAAQAEATRLKEELVQMDHQQNQFGQREQAIKESIRTVQSRLSTKRGYLEEARTQLTSIRQAERNKLLAYERNMSQLIQAIKHENGFRDKPVGPLGLHITLLKDNWMDVLENFFGRSLSAFVVTNYDDGEILKRLMKNVGCDAPMYVTPSRNFNMSEPDPRFDTVLRILEIDNETAKKHLIISNAIEQVILIEDLEEATSVMRNKSNNDNIQQCYALNRNRPGWGHKVGGGGGSMGVSPVRKWERAPRMKADSLSRIQGVEAEISHLEGEVRQLERQADGEDRELAHFNEMKSAHVRRKRDMGVEMQKWEEKAEDLKTKMDEIAADGQIGVLQENLKTQNDRKDLFERQYQEFVQTRDALNEAQNQLAAQQKAFDQDLNLAKRRVSDAKREYSEAQRKREQALVDKNHWFDKAVQYSEQANEARRARDMAEADYQEVEKGATEYCARVEVPAGETGESIDKRLLKLREELSRAEAALGGTADEIAKAYLKAREEHENAERQVEGLDMLLRVASKAFIERQHRWKLFQRYISARARAQFTYMMSERAFKGRLRLEHKERPPELIIEVQPGGEESGNRGPRTLSGGEKSFSTICLLLSLWEAMGSPFRCLDEFDVFMDSVNRSISVNMMIKAAERSISKQFILITPQAMDGFASPNVRIHRMNDPDRDGNQTRLRVNR